MLRDRTENWEEDYLSRFATLSRDSKGRKYRETPCDIRTIFQRDRDRIIHSKAFRRLKHKTQVFISPEGDHYRTRLTHTLEVAQIARTAARGLKLNEDLTEAIALGHDLGHTPFGHAGEQVLNEVSSRNFSHNIQSLRVVDHLEKKDKNKWGLNLSQEVRDGIRNHTGDDIPKTMEGQIVRIADRIAYINHDIDDALRANIIRKDDLPEEPLKILGKTHSQRIDTMVRDLINTSMNKQQICRSSKIKKATGNLRNFLFAKVYIGSGAKTEEQKAKRLLKILFNYYLNNIEKIPREYSCFDSEQIVIDYIAGMTDRYAIRKGRELFIPTPGY